MDARIAAELLYESEATLRMVDSVIDELHLSDALNAEPAQRPMLSLVTDAEGDEQFGDVGARAYWQVQDLLESVQDAKRLLAPTNGQREIPFGGTAPAVDLDAIFSVIDSLESIEERNAAQATLFSELRQQIGSALTSGLGAADHEQRTATAVEILAEVEARLTRLGHYFEDIDS